MIDHTVPIENGEYYRPDFVLFDCFPYRTHLDRLVGIAVAFNGDYYSKTNHDARNIYDLRSLARHSNISRGSTKPDSPSLVD